MAYTKKTNPKITLDPAVAAAAAAAAGGSTATKNPGWRNNTFTNTGLLDAKGQPITAPMTGNQVIATFLAQNKLPKNNLSSITRRLAALNYYNLGATPGQTSVSTPDAEALARYLAKIDIQRGSNLSNPVDFNASMTNDMNAATNPQSISPWAINTIRDSKSFDQPNVNASQQVVNDVFTSLLGRAATPKELQQYGNAYTQYAAKNPTNVGHGDTTYQVVGPTQRLLKSNMNDTSVSNNLTEQGFVENQLKATQAYSTAEGGNYFDAMMNALQGRARSSI